MVWSFILPVVATIYIVVLSLVKYSRFQERRGRDPVSLLSSLPPSLVWSFILLAVGMTRNVVLSLEKYSQSQERRDEGRKEGREGGREEGREVKPNSLSGGNNEKNRQRGNQG